MDFIENKCGARQCEESSDPSPHEHGSRGLLLHGDGKRRREVDGPVRPTTSSSTSAVEASDTMNTGPVRRSGRLLRASLHRGTPSFISRDARAPEEERMLDLEDVVEYCERRCSSAPCSMRKLFVSKEMGKEKRSQVSECVTPDAGGRGNKKPNLMETPVVTVSMDTDVPSAASTVDRELLRNSLRDDTANFNSEEAPASGLLNFDAVEDEWEADWEEGDDWWAAVEERINQMERRVEVRLHAKLGEYEDEMICWRVQMEKELLAVREDQTYFARVINELKEQEAERT